MGLTRKNHFIGKEIMILLHISANYYQLSQDGFSV